MRKSLWSMPVWVLLAFCGLSSAAQAQQLRLTAPTPALSPNKAKPAALALHAPGKTRGKVKPAGAGALKIKPAPGVLVGGALMTPDKDLVANAVNSTEHTTLVSAVAASGLVTTLQGPGPFTVFAPTNAAFDKLPAGTVNAWVMPENKQKLSTILSYHVVAGRLTAADLQDGQVLTTLDGARLTVLKKGNSLTLRDAKGGLAQVTTPDVLSSNGVTHVVDAVLLPPK